MHRAAYDASCACYRYPGVLKIYQKFVRPSTISPEINIISRARDQKIVRKISGRIGETTRAGV